MNEIKRHDNGNEIIDYVINKAVWLIGCVLNNAKSIDFSFKRGDDDISFKITK